jgi:hypothetical protein
MNPDEIFAKTAKGIEEIETRSHQLGFRHRAALIQVNGRNPVGALLGSIPGDGESYLSELWRDGFIESVSGNLRLESAEPVVADAPAANVDQGFDLLAAKLRAARAIETLLGPDGDPFAIRIERASTLAEFTEHAQRTRTVIQQIRGAARSKEFWDATGL